MFVLANNYLIMTRYLLIAYVLGLIASASAAEIDFSYNPNNLPTHGYGYDREETYDVAIRIDEPSLNGTVIKGLNVALPGGNTISNCSGWLSNELTLKRINGKYINEPDITITDGSLTDGILTVIFTEPYTIAGPVYVGYSFTVDNLADGSNEPLTVVDGINPDGLYVHSSRTKLKWNSVSASTGSVSAMKVIVDGDFKNNAASFVGSGELICSAEEENPVFMVELANHGLNVIENFSYEYSVDGISKQGDINLTEPIPANWGAYISVPIETDQLSIPGKYDFVLNVTTVNGQPNNDTNRETILPLQVYPFIPVNRPLVEEYTGLWCGYCPRSYVALETMHEEYPERFIGVAYHSGDAMGYEGGWPNSPSGFPDGYINRTKVSLGDIYTIWPNYADTMSPADITVSIEWTDESHSSLKATSSTRFMEDISKANYGVGYMLLIDGLTDPTWAQVNYYAPAEGEEPIDKPDMPGKWGELFTHGTNPMIGLIYNDVIISGKYIVDGFNGSIPEQIIANEQINHSCVFNLNELSKPHLVQDKNKLRVVAVLIDRKKGKPVNCNTSIYPDGTDNSKVETLPESVKVISTEWYTLQGLRISIPTSGMGLLIRVDRKSDGSTNATKQFF